jgi:hypothetical protein
MKFNYVTSCWYEVNVKINNSVLENEQNYGLNYIK